MNSKLKENRKMSGSAPDSALGDGNSCGSDTASSLGVRCGPNTASSLSVRPLPTPPSGDDKGDKAWSDFEKSLEVF